MGRGGSCACADGRKLVNLVNGTSGRVARALYLDDEMRFRPGGRFQPERAKPSDTWPLGQAGRERNVGP
ncbi:hypothetical protein P5673_006302 [Acropora cervicornis]|uniref:Uncharacterized protein n=1 Tax=Acropora cervicornis TaxID=6130 RepID=A0AAD9QYD1_ACRCE|nr:hypothetical protein P5673_006302 [Acropora cervicornis]